MILIPIYKTAYIVEKLFKNLNFHVEFPSTLWLFDFRHKISTWSENDAPMKKISIIDVAEETIWKLEL